MKHFGAAALAVTIFIVAWSILAGLMAVVSLMLGGTETAAGKAMAYVAFGLGTTLSGTVAVYVTGRMVKELSSLRVWLSFAVAAVAVSTLFTAPWYMEVENPIGHGTPEALQAVVIGVILAVIGGFGGRVLVSRHRAALLARQASEQARNL